MPTSNHGLASSVFGDSIYERLDEEDDEEEANIGSNQSLLERQHPIRLGLLSNRGIMALNKRVATSDDDDSDDGGMHGTSSVRFTNVNQTERHDLERNDEESDGEHDVEPRSLLLETPRIDRSRSKRSRRIPWNRKGPEREESQRTDFNQSTPKNFSALPAFKLLNPRERALWKWANVENLDLFLQEVYSYFLGNGIYCILLNRALNMATIMFVVGFSTYLGSCIDYSKIATSKRLADIEVPHCMSKMGGLHRLALWLFIVFWFIKLFQYTSDIRRLIELQNFYYYLLDISDNDMQTISWQHVVQRLNLLRDQNLVTATRVDRSKAGGSQSKQRMDPHDIANRIMRKENFFIAMINKNILDFRIPIPSQRFQEFNFFTRTLEWSISLCIMDFVFNEQGQVRPVFLKESHRRVLSSGLRRRFVFAGVMNIICAPFIVVYLTLLYFFRYFNEYHKNPSALGSRQYTPYAEWKMREYNELYHFFHRRLNMSYPAASRYVNQFPKEKTVLLSRFVAFLAGSFAAVLGITSLIDPELFLGFEITKDRTVLFYIGLFGSIVAISRGMIPDEALVFDPEISLRYVAEFTHFIPKEWEGKLHSEWVKNEFSKLYDLKLLIILKELVSVIITPFILWISLPKCSDKIIDFFRENTVHVHGLGYVCSYAMFDFNKSVALNDKFRNKDLHGTTDAKMLKSYLNFMDSYGDHRGDGLLKHDALLCAAKKSATQKEVPIDIENSVMAKFNRLHPSAIGKSKLDTVPSDTSLYQGENTPAIRYSEVQPVDRSYDLATDLSDEQESNSGQMYDGGVLGLLNQFYKQTDAPNSHRIQ